MIHVTVVCNGCFRKLESDSQRAVVAVIMARARGWHCDSYNISPRRDLCPECVRSPKPVPRTP